MVKLIWMDKEKNYVGIRFQKDISELLELDPDDDHFVLFEIDKEKNDIKNKDILVIRMHWERWEESGII